MKVAHYAMVNIVAGREIVPECIQWRASPALVAQEALSMFQGDRLQQVSQNLSTITGLLRRPSIPANLHPGAQGDVPSGVAARILEFLNKKGGT